MRNRTSKRPKTHASVFAVSPLGVNTPNNTTLVQSQQHLSKLSHHVPPPPPTHLHLHTHTQNTPHMQTQPISIWPRERGRRRGEEEEKKERAGKEERRWRRDQVAEPKKRVRESECKIWSYGRPVKLGLYFVVSRLLEVPGKEKIGDYPRAMRASLDRL
ncbi:hypothetical protein Scep_029286 [Stephania cephalantha]|uniref:Uncharacterized protein n=1 Tax=Stephania cephalantha TaxID=152367 RepID=A0AAP0HHF6_9MAGN